MGAVESHDRSRSTYEVTAPPVHSTSTSDLAYSNVHGIPSEFFLTQCFYIDCAKCCVQSWICRCISAKPLVEYHPSQLVSLDSTHKVWGSKLSSEVMSFYDQTPEISTGLLVEIFDLSTF